MRIHLEELLTEKVRFFVVWRDLESAGQVDAYASQECWRVWQEWKAADFPQPLSQFILRAANGRRPGG